MQGMSDSLGTDLALLHHTENIQQSNRSHYYKFKLYIYLKTKTVKNKKKRTFPIKKTQKYETTYSMYR